MRVLHVTHQCLPALGGSDRYIADLSEELARRNLTSHLREPSLDPTLERQVAFNQTMLVRMEQILE